MVKVSGFRHDPAVLDAMRSLGIDPNVVRRLVIVVEEGDVPVVHVELVGDPAIVDMAAVIAGSRPVVVEHYGPRYHHKAVNNGT